MNTVNLYPINPIFKGFFPIAKRRNITVNKPQNNFFEYQKLTDDMFFVDMQFYEANKKYAKKMIDSTYEISDLIKQKKDFSTILNTAQKRVKEAYKNTTLEDQIVKKYDLNSYCLIKRGRGGEYFDKYVTKCKAANPERYYSPKTNKKYKNANVCQMHSIGGIVYVYEGWGGKYSNLELAKKAYDELLKNKNPKIDDIINTTATIHWLIAQEAPFQRGNESISNLICKAIFCAYNIRISPLKSGISTDFEAWYRNLDNYIKVYPKLFKKRPHKIIELNA